MQILKGIILVTQLFILFIFSFEIECMPNHIHRPDKWHVFIPFVVFMAVLILEFIGGIVLMILNKKVAFDLIIGVGLSFWGLTLMANSHGFFETIGFVVSLLIGIYFSIALYLNSRKTNAY